jgi:hypothetical protein
LSGGTVSGSVTVSELYTNGWLRNNNNNTGMYNQTNGNHFYSRAGNRWGITGNATASNVYIDFYGNHQTTYRGSIHADTSNNLGFLNTSESWSFRVDTSGNAYTTGSLVASSDERLKTNWRDLPEDFVEKLSKVKHGTYDRIDETLTQDGVSAQSLQDLLPNSVHESIDGMLSVAYGNAALVATIKLAERVISQEARIAKLEALVETLINKLGE